MSTHTNPDVRIQEGGTEFLVPTDTPGMRFGKTFNKSGWRFYQNGELIFENARVQHARRDSARDAAQPRHTWRSRGDAMPVRVDKLVRDAVIWTHLAGDSVQRMKTVRRMKWD